MSAHAYIGVHSVDQQHKKPLCHPWLRRWAKPCHNSYHRHTAIAYLTEVWMYSEVPELGTSFWRELKRSGWKESPVLHPGLHEVQGHTVHTFYECDMMSWPCHTRCASLSSLSLGYPQHPGLSGNGRFFFFPEETNQNLFSGRLHFQM